MNPILRVFRRNFGYKALSVGVAVLLYLIAKNQETHFTGDIYVQPQVIGLPADRVVEIEPAGGMLSVTGPASAVSAFKSQGVKATVDVSRARVGVNQLPVTYKTPTGVEMNSEPHTAEVTIERRVSKDYFVDVLLDQAPPPAGFIYADPIVDPRQVTVSGVSAEIERVARVVAIVHGGSNKGNIVQTIDLVAQTADQQPVDSVEIIKPRVQVQVPIRPIEMVPAATPLPTATP